MRQMIDGARAMATHRVPERLQGSKAVTHEQGSLDGADRGDRQDLPGGETASCPASWSAVLVALQEEFVAVVILRKASDEILAGPLAGGSG